MGLRVWKLGFGLMFVAGVGLASVQWYSPAAQTEKSLASPYAEATAGQFPQSGTTLPGMRAHLDDAGNFLSEPAIPTPEAPAPKDLAQEFTLVEHKSGLVELNFNGALMTATVATLNPDGTLSYQCSTPCNHPAHSTPSKQAPQPLPGAAELAGE